MGNRLSNGMCFGNEGKQIKARRESVKKAPAAAVTASPCEQLARSYYEERINETMLSQNGSAIASKNCTPSKLSTKLTSPSADTSTRKNSKEASSSEKSPVPTITKDAPAAAETTNETVAATTTTNTSSIISTNFYPILFDFDKNLFFKDHQTDSYFEQGSTTIHTGEWLVDQFLNALSQFKQQEEGSHRLATFSPEQLCRVLSKTDYHGSSQSKSTVLRFETDTFLSVLNESRFSNIDSLSTFLEATQQKLSHESRSSADIETSQILYQQVPVYGVHVSVNHIVYRQGNFNQPRDVVYMKVCKRINDSQCVIVAQSVNLNKQGFAQSIVEASNQTRSSSAVTGKQPAPSKFMRADLILSGMIVTFENKKQLIQLTELHSLDLFCQFDEGSEQERLISTSHARIRSIEQELLNSLLTRS